MKPQLFLDLDGVFADDATFYEKTFGIRPKIDQFEPPNYKKNIREHPDFYGSLPLMKDARALFNACIQLHRFPIFLTGVPDGMPAARNQKIDWVRRHFGPQYKVICCRSEDKYIHAKKGDVLLDDRSKYAKRWIDAGGYFVLHVGVNTSITALSTYYMRHP